MTEEQKREKLVVYCPPDRPDLTKTLIDKTDWNVLPAKCGPGSKFSGLTHMQNGYQARTLLWCSDLDTTNLFGYYYTNSAVKGEDTRDDCADPNDGDRYGVWSDKNVTKEYVAPPKSVEEVRTPGHLLPDAFFIKQLKWRHSRRGKPI
jgi:hypothetical protein